MRLFLIPIALAPLPVLADTFILPSQPTEAVIYQGGAMVTREVDVDIPGGRHTLVIPGMPEDLNGEQLTLDLPGLQLLAMRIRDMTDLPQSAPERPEVTAARDRIEAIEADIQAVEDRARTAELEAEAAEAQIKFLADLGSNQAIPADPTALADIGAMIARETLAAEGVAQTARQNARTERMALTDLKDRLSEAQAELDQLLPTEAGKAVYLDVAAAETGVTGPIRLSFMTDAAWWEPAYTFHLNSGPEPNLVLERGATVMQQTAENWQDVALTVSTQNINAGTSPSPLWPDLRRIEDPAPSPQLRQTAQASRQSLAAPVAEMMIVEDAVTMSVTGQSLTYSFAQPVTLLAGRDAAYLPFDELRFNPDIFARAIPLSSETAFAMASFTNTSEEPILSGTWRFFYDGGFVGLAGDDVILPGEEAELGFGPIPGLTVERTVLRRNEGDRGVITRSNEQTENARIDVRNLTDRTWAIQLRDRVPFSEQEDLVVRYESDPSPTVTDLEDRRGILQWEFDLAPGGEEQVMTSYRLTWPEDKELR